MGGSVEKTEIKLDEFGSCSVIKHEIIKDYAREYTK